MLQVSLDTSFLISFADPARPNHLVAVEYFRHCLTRHIPMWISTIVTGEFEVRQRVTDLPLQNFRILPYNLLHSVKAAALFRALESQSPISPQDTRRVVINDLKIIAQAEEESIPVILTEDENTLARLATRLRGLNAASVQAVLLAKGFAPGRLEDPGQEQLPLS